MYVLAFIPLYRLLGPTTTALVGLPVAVTAWLFGMSAGLLASLLAFPLSALLVTLAGEAGWDVVIRGVLGFGLLVFIGIAIGRLRDLGERAKWELTERVRAEEELRKYRDHLEELVDERTAELTRANEQLRQEATERKRVEERLDHLNAVLRAIRSVNQLITREKDRDRLLQGACERFIETGGYYSAWGVLLDEAGGPVLSGAEGLVATAEAGLGEAFLPLAEQLERGELPSCGQRALSQSEVVVIKDPTFSTCTDCPLLDKYDGQAAMTVRLEHEGKVYGLLSVSIPTARAADEEGRSLFEEVAGDIAFALHSMELEEDRQRVEEALRESEERFRAIFETAQDSIFIKDRTLKYTQVNPAMEKLFELPASKLIGLTDEDLFGEEAGAHIREVDSRVLGGEIIEEDHTKPVRGIPHTFHVIKVPMRDNSGEIIGLCGIARDITERKRAEEALRVSEERFALAVQGSDAGLWDWDIQNNSLYWSPRLKELLGYADDELDVDFDTFESLLHPDDREHTGAAIEAHLRDRGLYDVEQRLRTKSGEYRWFRARGQALWDEAGNPVRMIGFTTDITERKRVEEALRIRDWAIESSINAIAMADLEGSLTYVNPSFLKLWGYGDDKEVLGRPAVEFWQMKEKAAEVVKALRERGGWMGELVGMKKDGSLFDVQLLASMVTDEAGKPIRMMSSFVDITERKRAEEALKEYSERLEEMVEERTRELRDAQEQLVRREKLAVLGQLAGGVGHELRNPLGVISNAVYFLQMTLSDADQTTKEYLEIISEEVRNSAKIVSDLLDFSRTKMPDKQEVAVSDLVAEVLEKRPPPEGVEAIAELAPDLPPVFVDPRQMGQV
ncbi:MAG: PAS domain S-box protein, partial [Anaerolineae bacterium]